MEPPCAAPVPRVETATQSAPRHCSETGIRLPFVRSIVASAPVRHSARSRERRSSRAMRSRSDSASSTARSASHSDASWPSRSSNSRSQCIRQSVGDTIPRLYELSTFLHLFLPRPGIAVLYLLTRRPPRSRVRHDAPRVLRTPADTDHRAARPCAASAQPHARRARGPRRCQRSRSARPMVQRRGVP